MNKKRDIKSIQKKAVYQSSDKDTLPISLQLFILTRVESWPILMSVTDFGRPHLWQAKGCIELCLFLHRVGKVTNLRPLFPNMKKIQEERS